MNSGGVVREDVKALDLNADDVKVFPAQLTPVISLDVDQCDFQFKSGINFSSINFILSLLEFRKEHRYMY